MAQLNNTFTYSALDTSTAPGTPITGLTNVRFNLYKINRDSSGVVTGGTQVVTNGLCVEIGGGGYAYTYTGYSPSIEYYYYFTPNDSRCYVEQGATDPIEQLISEVRGGGGGASINISGIQTTIRNARDTIVEEIGKAKDETLTSINETNSHIDIAKGEITNKIESIEIPETDLSDLSKSIGVARQQLTKLSEYLRKEAESEKKEMKDKYEGKISELEDTIDGIEAMFEEFKGMSQEEKKTILESKENELKEITDFADEAIEYYKELKDSAKSQGEEEIKSKLKSIL